MENPLWQIKTSQSFLIASFAEKVEAADLELTLKIVSKHAKFLNMQKIENIFWLYLPRQTNHNQS